MQPSGLPSDPDLEAVRERRQSLRVAMGHLERVLALPPAVGLAEWSGEVLAATTELQDCLRQHIEATEGPDGFHGEMVAAAPRLTHGVEVLVREHAKLSGLAVQIAALAGRAQLPVDADAIRETGMRLIGLLIRHRQRGADLIYEAYQSDLGGEN